MCWQQFVGCSSLVQFGYGTWTDVLEGNCLRFAWTAFRAVHMLSILPGIRLDSGEWVEAGETVDSTERQQILRLAASRRKQNGDVVQLVRMLPCHGRGRGFEPRRPRHKPHKNTRFMA